MWRKLNSDREFLVFQTGLGRPVVVSQTSIQKARTVLDQECAKRSGKKLCVQACIFLLHNAQGHQLCLFFYWVQDMEILMSPPLLFKLKHQRLFWWVVAWLWMIDLLHLRGVFQCKVHGFLKFPVKGFFFISFKPVLLSSQIWNNKNIYCWCVLDICHTNHCHPTGNFLEADGHLPLFQTGLGRSISVSKGSIKRASALLEPRNITKELEGRFHSTCCLLWFCHWNVFLLVYQG